MSLSSKSLQCDILVVGGGLSGCCAALSAAREGATVILCQDRSVLGGNASSEIRMHIVGADSNGYRNGRPVEVEAREGGLIEELRLRQAAENPTRSPHGMDLILYDMIRSEPNITLLLDTHVRCGKTKGNLLQYAHAYRSSCEEEFHIHARAFIDASGDSALAVSAGNPYRVGREARSEFGESHGRERADSHCLGSTVLFQAVRLDRPVPFSPPAWARKFTEYDLRLRPHSLGSSAGGEDTGYEYGFWWLEWGGDLDTIRDNDRIRHELLSIAYGVWDHLKNGGPHGAENYALTWVGMLPGKRESRRLVGRATLTEECVTFARDWPDAIAYGGWFIDLHPPLGVDSPEEEPCTQIPVPYLYPIPLSACVSPNLENLFFAGRNISATHIAFASTRVMGTCGAVGQGVGIAAALAAKNNWSISALLETARTRIIQQAILRQDGFLIGVRNEDARDMARRARISSSGYEAGGEPENILDGWTRSVHGPRGVKPGVVPAGSHRWLSGQLPAWIQLEWAEPILLHRIQLIFDSGLHRWLSLTQSNAVHERNIWGPQPEMVRDYELLIGSANGEWSPLVTVAGNFQRLRVHHFPPVTITKLRLQVLSTHGCPEARVVEIRCE